MPSRDAVADVEREYRREWGAFERRAGRGQDLAWLVVERGSGRSDSVSSEYDSVRVLVLGAQV